MTPATLSNVTLNPQQKLAVETTEGPVLIIAGPGSGKTRVITQRIAHLIDDLDTPPRNILAVTFTNKAAAEMANRVIAATQTTAKGATIGTFHRLCGGLLRRNGQTIGIKPDFTVYDREDQLSVVKHAMEMADINPKQVKPEDILSRFSLAKSKMITPEAYQDLHKESRDDLIVATVLTYPIYQDTLTGYNALDFDDMLTRTVDLLLASPSLHAHYQHQFRYIMVDEFQDTNVVQYELTKLLTDRRQNICVVGDPDQSIYGWRAADINNILNFEEHFPNTQRIHLGQNYRSTGTILAAAQELISCNTKRIPNPLHTENPTGDMITIIETETPNDEAAVVVNNIENDKHSQNRPWTDYAVMYRSNQQSRTVEEACIRLGIPYRIFGGVPFYQRREIKDTLAYLRIIANPADTASLQRIINIPHRGIGPQTLRRLSDHSNQGHISLMQTIAEVAAAERQAIFQTQPLEQPLDRRAQCAVANFHNLIQHLDQQYRQHDVTELFDAVFDATQLKEYITAAEDGEARWDNVIELRSIAADFPGHARDDQALNNFLQHIALVTDPAEEQQLEGFVTLSTLHSAKGLEFSSVAITGLCQTVIPSPRSDDIEEERRLFYVGITRAKNNLSLSWSERMHGRSASPTPFLDEIPSLDWSQP